MKLLKDDLCSACLKIRPRMNDGSLAMPIEDFFDSEGYNVPMGYMFVNPAILTYLEDNSGCQACISLLKRVTGL